VTVVLPGSAGEPSCFQRIKRAINKRTIADPHPNFVPPHPPPQTQAAVPGGLLIADEVIDVFLPVLYFAVQRRRWAKVHRVSLWNSPVSAGRQYQPVPAPPVVSASGPEDGPG
jgi:hypothetical protein